MSKTTEPKLLNFWEDAACVLGLGYSFDKGLTPFLLCAILVVGWVSLKVLAGKHSVDSDKR